MIYTIVLVLTSGWSPLSPGSPEAPPAHAAVVQDNAEFETRRKAAGDDVDKLWQLYLWCKEKKLDKEGKSTLRRIVKLEPTHQEANEALGNVLYEGKWFPSQRKVDEYKKEQEAKKAKEQGLVEYKGQLVPAADVPFLEKGLVKDDAGNWVDGDLQRKIKEGWVKQDMEWVSPADKPQIEKGLWKCGDKWSTLEEANKYHSSLAHWWRIPGDHYILYTTCDRDVATDKVKKNLDPAWEDLVRVYGHEPQSPVVVVILRDQKQYESFAAGDEDEEIPQTETHGLSSVHYAYFADVGLDPVTQEFMGAGVSYWDASTDAGNKWGIHSVRHALGHSFGEAMDPSPKFWEKLRKSKSRFDPKPFWAEKKLPAWFRWGAAVYAERYFVDTLVARGGNNHWARDWSVQNLLTRGGLRPLKEIFEADIRNEGESNDQIADAQKLINEEGLLVSFALDGDCAPVKEKLKALQDAMKNGKDAKAIGEAADALQAEVIKHEADLRKFAGL